MELNGADGEQLRHRCARLLLIPRLHTRAWLPSLLSYNTPCHLPCHTTRHPIYETLACATYCQLPRTANIDADFDWLDSRLTG